MCNSYGNKLELKRKDIDEKMYKNYVGELNYHYASKLFNPYIARSFRIPREFYALKISINT